MRYLGALAFAAGGFACLLGALVAGRENRHWATALTISALALMATAAVLVI